MWYIYIYFIHTLYKAQTRIDNGAHLHDKLQSRTTNGKMLEIHKNTAPSSTYINQSQSVHKASPADQTFCKTSTGYQRPNLQQDISVDPASGLAEMDCCHKKQPNSRALTGQQHQILHLSRHWNFLLLFPHQAVSTSDKPPRKWWILLPYIPAVGPHP